ncbi:hypothetical protein CL657_02325 [bacterium]|nr:hypothetical protein [bacterium]
MKVILISPYKNDHDVFNDQLESTMYISFYDNAKDALDTIEDHTNDVLILLSTKIADIAYEDVIDHVFDISKEIKIIVFSTYSMIDDINLCLEKGVYDFIVGDDIYSKVTLAINSMSKQSKQATASQKSITAISQNKFAIFEMIDSMKINSLCKELDEIIKIYDTWFEKSLSNLNDLPILIIEDEDVFRKLLVDMVSQSFSKITDVAEGLKGFELLKSNTFGVAIIDLFLNDSDGVELIRKLKVENPLLQIIVVTAFDLVDVASNVLKMGVSDYLQKPITKQDLLAAINKAQNVYKNNLIKQRAIDEFFCKHLDSEQKYCLLEGLFHYKNKCNKPFLMEDLYQVFPELINKNIYEKTKLPPIISKESIKRFVSSFTYD